MPQNNNNNTLKNIVTTFDNNGNLNNSKKKSGLLPKILSVFAAIVLWLYVFQAVEYETKVKNIPITLVNFNSSLGFDVVSGYENALDLTLTGTKSVINAISEKDIKATVDMSGVVEKGTHTLPVSIDVPGSAKVSNQSVLQIQVTVDKTVEKELSIVPSVNYNIQYPYELGESKISANKVIVKGPEADINTISHAVVNVALGNVNNDIISNSEIKLVDRNNYEIDSKHIYINPSVVELFIPVFKTVLVDIEPVIELDTDLYEYTVSPSRVYLYGSVKDVEAVTSVKTEKLAVHKEGEYKIKIQIPQNVSAYLTYNQNRENRLEMITVNVTKKPVPVIDEAASTNNTEDN